MLKRTLLASAILACASSTHAYNFEGTYTLSGGTTQPEMDGDKGDKQELLDHQVDLTVYLQDIDVSKGAWNEAAFLNKASSVTGSMLLEERKVEDSDDDDKSTTNSFSLGGRAVVNDFIFDASIATSKDNDDGSKTQMSSFGFGSYIGDNHSVTGDVTFRSGDDFVGSFNGFDLGANYHGYFPVGTSEMSMSLDARASIISDTYNGVSDTDSTGGGVDIVFTYFPFPQFGLGAELQTLSRTISQPGADDVDETRARSTIFANWYPVEQFRIGAQFYAQNQELENDDNKLENNGAGAALDLRIRF
ncbi:Uncharacterised protein [BD1-7 clade bacterium]|uniref:Porin domain-containing protein n=1 Tax=BD1-7 clade bacterium TaxID=2029982 RepID=A0A5S9NUW8_9GAMM|nr:Uncharacterised protein [BD1-7 clade bacterium]CAA0109776.1 Uncharacterised protein [BD1-7 clade bacterium]